MDWTEHIRARFPDWKTEAALRRWPEDRTKLRIGQQVSGPVVARAPFGVWVDIEAGHPALLLGPEMRNAKERRITFGDYPVIGEIVEACIVGLGDSAEIALSQNKASLNPPPISGYL
jgi:hypothetical protein